MQLPVIKTYTGGVVNRPHCFYVLNKGENAGKPLREPCPNCFTVLCESEEEKQYWFWLCWGLWKSGRFRIHLIGSVILFIRIDELRNELYGAGRTFIGKRPLLSKALQTMKQLEEHQQAARQRIQLMDEMKRTIFLKILQR